MALHEDFEDQRSLLEQEGRPKGALPRRVGPVALFASAVCLIGTMWMVKPRRSSVSLGAIGGLIGKEETAECTANGENCMDSKCCSDKAATCFKKNDHWASCNKTCDAFNFWNTKTNQFEVHENPQWECSPLGCTPDGANCTESMCCANEGSTCFKKNDHWASCNKTCEPNNFWNFETQKFEKHENPQWTCDVLGEPVAVECTANGQNCMDSKCCSEEGATCFKKNDHWASCNKTCDAFNFWNTKTNQFEVHENPQWTCDVLGDPAAVECTANGENCMDSECCTDKAATCFKKNDHWASCNKTCDAFNFWNTKTNQFEVHENPQWECSPLGCTPDGANCTESMCCANEGSTCFKKNDHWASCNKTCEPNNFWNFETQKFEKHENPQWTCDVLS